MFPECDKRKIPLCNLLVGGGQENAAAEVERAHGVRVQRDVNLVELRDARQRPALVGVGHQLDAPARASEREEGLGVAERESCEQGGDEASMLKPLRCRALIGSWRAPGLRRQRRGSPVGHSCSVTATRGVRCAKL
eukprot:1278569-Prymnesium_polylepis.1